MQDREKQFASRTNDAKILELLSYMWPRCWKALITISMVFFQGVELKSQQADPNKRKEYVPSTQVRVSSDIVYRRLGDRELKLDVYTLKNKTKDPAPCIIVIHGGAWMRGDKERFAPIASRLAEEGFVAVSISYRLSPETPFPAAIHDVKTAVRWVRAKASMLGIDPQQVGALGGSAGAHLALLLATSAGVVELEGDGENLQYGSRIQAAVGLATPTDFESFDSPELRQFLAVPKSTHPETWKLASPTTHVNAGDPPILLMHSVGDPTVPVSQSEILKARYDDAALEAQFERVDSDAHGFVWREVWFEKTMQMAIDFFHEKLKE